MGQTVSKSVTEDADVNELLEEQYGNGEELPLDEVLMLLKNERRRLALQYLESLPDEETTLDDLALHVAAAENDRSVDNVSTDQRRRVYIGLYQVHLPRLDRFGVIEYDKDRGIVALTANGQFDRFLTTGELVDESAPVKIGAAIGVVSLVGLTSVGPFGMVPLFGWAILSTCTLLVLTALLWRTGAEREGTRLTFG